MHLRASLQTVRRHDVGSGVSDDVVGSRAKQATFVKRASLQQGFRQGLLESHGKTTVQAEVYFVMYARPLLLQFVVHRLEDRIMLAEQYLCTKLNLAQHLTLLPSQQHQLLVSTPD